MIASSSNQKPYRLHLQVGFSWGIILLVKIEDGHLF